VHPSPAPVDLAAPAWRFDAEEHRLGTHLGRDALCLRNGIATLADAAFTDGVLEVDLALGAERSFTGLTWRVLDGQSFEEFFLRPHRSGNADATQYTPVFNGVSAWQLYHGPRYTVPLEIPVHEWFRLRIAVEGARAEIFVADLDRPALVVEELKRPVAEGGVGLLSGEAAGWFSSFAFAAVAPRSPMIRDVPHLPGVVPAWSVSDAVPESLLGDAPVLDPALVAARAWTPLPAEPEGLADLARVNGLRDGRDTALARATVHAAGAGARRLDVGFSDRARVYLDGRLLFRGDDPYRSRDDRFLGSIGWWDALWLPLEEGPNELVVAVTEEFGGWGVQARFAEPYGLAFETERGAGSPRPL